MTATHASAAPNSDHPNRPYNSSISQLIHAPGGDSSDYKSENGVPRHNNNGGKESDAPTQDDPQPPAINLENGTTSSLAINQPASSTTSPDDLSGNFKEARIFAESNVKAARVPFAALAVASWLVLARALLDLAIVCYLQGDVALALRTALEAYEKASSQKGQTESERIEANNIEFRASSFIIHSIFACNQLFFSFRNSGSEDTIGQYREALAKAGVRMGGRQPDDPQIQKEYIFLTASFFNRVARNIRPDVGAGGLGIKEAQDAATKAVSDKLRNVEQLISGGTSSKDSSDLDVSAMKEPRRELWFKVEIALTKLYAAGFGLAAAKPLLLAALQGYRDLEEICIRHGIPMKERYGVIEGQARCLMLLGDGHCTTVAQPETFGLFVMERLDGSYSPAPPSPADPDPTNIDLDVARDYYAQATAILDAAAQSRQDNYNYERLRGRLALRAAFLLTLPTPADIDAEPMHTDESESTARELKVNYAGARDAASTAVELFDQSGDMLGKHLAQVHMVIYSVLEGGEGHAYFGLMKAIGEWGKTDGSLGFATALGHLISQTGRLWFVKSGNAEKSFGFHQLAEQLHLASGSIFALGSCQVAMFKLLGDHGKIFASGPGPATHELDAFEHVKLSESARTTINHLRPEVIKLVSAAFTNLATAQGCATGQDRKDYFKGQSILLGKYLEAQSKLIPRSLGSSASASPMAAEAVIPVPSVTLTAPRLLDPLVWLSANSSRIHFCAYYGGLAQSQGRCPSGHLLTACHLCGYNYPATQDDKDHVVRVEAEAAKASDPVASLYADMADCSYCNVGCSSANCRPGSQVQRSARYLRCLRKGPVDTRDPLGSCVYCTPSFGSLCTSRSRFDEKMKRSLKSALKQDLQAALRAPRWTPSGYRYQKWNAALLAIPSLVFSNLSGSRKMYRNEGMFWEAVRRVTESPVYPGLEMYVVDDTTWGPIPLTFPSPRDEMDSDDESSWISLPKATTQFYHPSLVGSPAASSDGDVTPQAADNSAIPVIQLDDSLTHNSDNAAMDEQVERELADESIDVEMSDAVASTSSTSSKLSKRPSMSDADKFEEPGLKPGGSRKMPEAYLSKTLMRKRLDTDDSDLTKVGSEDSEEELVLDQAIGNHHREFWINSALREKKLNAARKALRENTIKRRRLVQ